MELHQIWILARRWARLLVLGLILGLAAGYYYTDNQVPIYQAGTKVMVMRNRQSDVASGSDLSAQELIQTYIELVNTRPVIEETSVRLGFGVSGGQVAARRVGNTSLLEVTVRDDNPEEAALIANQVVEVLIEQNELLQMGLFSQSEESLQAQIAQVEERMFMLQDEIEASTEESLESREARLAEEKMTLETQIADLRLEIATLEVEIESRTPRATSLTQPVPTLSARESDLLSTKRAELAQKQFELQLAQARYSALVSPTAGSGAQDAASTRTDQRQATLALYQQIHSTLLSNYEAVRLARLQSTAHVVQIEPAMTPGSPISPRLFNNLLLGAALGLFLAGGLAFVIEYADTTLKAPTDVANVLGVPIIGLVAEDPKLSEPDKLPYVMRHPRSPLADGMRSLRTNLEFASVDRPLNTLLVTSPGSGAGKSTLLSNLAVTMTRTGQRVLVVDADLRRPSQHHAFRLLTNNRGLTTLLVESAASRTNGHEPRLDYYYQATEQEDLYVMASGPLPANPAELLGSREMADLLARLQEQFDVILIDGPPVQVADALVLSAKVDGILLVMTPGETRVDDARMIVEQLDRAGARLVGVVMTHIPKRYATYYGLYWGYQSGELSHVYYGEASKTTPGGLRGLGLRLLGRGRADGNTQGRSRRGKKAKRARQPAETESV